MSDAPVTLEHLAAGAYHDHHVLTVDGRDVVLRRCTGSQWGLAPAAQLAREYATLVALAPDANRCGGRGGRMGERLAMIRSAAPPGTPHRPRSFGGTHP